MVLVWTAGSNPYGYEQLHNRLLTSDDTPCEDVLTSITFNLNNK